MLGDFLPSDVVRRVLARLDSAVADKRLLAETRRVAATFGASFFAPTAVLVAVALTDLTSWFPLVLALVVGLLLGAWLGAVWPRSVLRLVRPFYADLSVPFVQGLERTLAQQGSQQRRAYTKLSVACAIPMLLCMVWLALAMLASLFVVVAPFVHEASFSQRLVVSACCALAISALVPCANGSWSAVRRFGFVRLVGGFLGLALFTWSAAEFSPNVFWLASKVMPSSPTEERVTIVKVAHAGASYRRSSITYLDHADSKPRYLVLSRRALSYSSLKPGDVVTLHGSKGPLGTSVNAVTQ